MLVWYLVSLISVIARVLHRRIPNTFCEWLEASAYVTNRPTVTTVYIEISLHKNAVIIVLDRRLEYTYISGQYSEA